MTTTKSKLTCIGCKKGPEEIQEYITEARMADTTPEQFLIEHEGTLHKFRRNKFYCTTCYIKAGMPVYN